MKNKLKIKAKFFIPMLATAGILSSMIIYFVINMETKYRSFLQEVEVKNTENIEKKLLKYERAAAGRKLEQTLRNLAKMNEALLNRNQLRRRYILMGDINLLFFNDKEKWRERQFYFDLAIRYYKRAIQNSESEIQKNMIIRRIAQLYMSKHEWKKTLETFKEANTNPMMPEERWRMKLNMAECYRHLGQYYKVLQLLDQVAEDGRDNPNTWAKALRQAADLKLQASENMDILKELLLEQAKATGGEPLLKEEKTKPNPENDKEDKTDAQIRNEKIQEARRIIEAKKHNEDVLKKTSLDLRQEALEDYQEIVKELPELNEESSLARIGILTIYVQEKNAQAAFELATKIYESSAPATSKAKALMLLAKLEIARHNKRYALDLLVKCQKEYGKTSLRTEILMDLYKLYTDKNIEKWENAFEVARELMMNKPEKWAVERVMQDFTPGKNKLLTVLSQSNNKEKYIQETKQMLEKLRSLEPEIWDSIENEAYFIFANLLFLSKKYELADEEIIKCLNTPKNSKKLKEKIYFLDLECAIASNAPPPVIVARAKRYLFWFPEGANYKQALMALLDGYYDMQMYQEARSVAKKIYIDYLNTAKKSKKEIEAEKTTWLKAFARIGEIYEKLGYNIQANKLIKAHSRQLLDTIWAPGAFMAWSRVAENQDQLYEAARRLDVAIPYVHEVNEKAKMYVAQYLLKLKIGKIRDYNRAKLLLEKLQESENIDPELKTELIRTLSEGMLEYTFKNKRQKDFNELLDFIVKKFKGETWPEYWVLRSLGPLFGTTKLETLSKRHEETLKKEFAELPKDKETVGFIRKQLKLINNLVTIENTIEELKIERGLGL